MALSQTDSYANNVSDQSPAADVNNTSAIGQKWSAETEIEVRQSAATSKDLTTNTAPYNVNRRPSAEHDQRHSRRNSNTQSNTHSSTHSNISKNSSGSSVALEQNVSRPADQHNESAAHKDSVRSATVTDADDVEVLTTSNDATLHETTQQSRRRMNNTSKSFNRKSDVQSAKEKEQVMFSGKIQRCFFHN